MNRVKVWEGNLLNMFLRENYVSVMIKYFETGGDRAWDESSILLNLSAEKTFFLENAYRLLKTLEDKMEGMPSLWEVFASHI